MREELERLRKDEPTDQLTADAPSDGAKHRQLFLKFRLKNPSV